MPTSPHTRTHALSSRPTLVPRPTRRTRFHHDTIVRFSSTDLSTEWSDLKNPFFRFTIHRLLFPRKPSPLLWYQPMIFNYTNHQYNSSFSSQNNDLILSFVLFKQCIRFFQQAHTVFMVSPKLGRQLAFSLTVINRVIQLLPAHVSMHERAYCTVLYLSPHVTEIIKIFQVPLFFTVHFYS